MSRSRVVAALEVGFVLLLAATAVVQIHTTAAGQWEGGRGVHDVLALGLTLPLLLRRRNPVAVFVVVLAAAWVQYELGGGLGQPFFCLLIALYGIGAHADEPGTWLGPVAVVALVVGVDVPRLQDGARWDEVVPAWFVLVGLWGLGRWLRHRRLEAARLTERATVAETQAEERARTAVVEERARIASELHDLVSHNIGVVVLQAQGAQRALDHAPDQARAALENIETAAREGLAEMRRLLGLLSDADRGDLEPQPSLAGLEDLVARVRAAGTPVDLDLRGDPRVLAPGVELAAYRVVQEALTNAIKHAPGAPVRVAVDCSADVVRLCVEDDGGGGTTSVDSGGHGIVGMRERVSLYGGELVTGPRPTGGFAVSARIPAAGAR